MGQSDGGVPEFNFTTPSVAQIDLSPVLPGPRPVFPSGILVHLANGKQLAFENGNVKVELAGSPAALCEGAADADYPSVAPGRDGRVAIAWQEFTGERDRLVLREWDGKAWSATAKIESEQTADMLRPAAAYDATLHLARAYRLSSYGASYLELALREGLPLATLDGPVRKAAEAAGIRMFG